MKLINKDVDHAVKALLYIARKDAARVSAAELAKEYALPYPFLRRILQILSREGVISSFKGKGGGFVLAVSPRKIHLGELIRIFRGRVSLSACVFKAGICPNARSCPLRKKIRELQKAFVSELESITLAQLMESDKRSQRAARRRRVPLTAA